MTKYPSCLVGEIGGTNVRLAFADIAGDAPTIINARNFRRDRFADFASVLDHYLAGFPTKQPASIVVAVAGPVRHGSVTLTNGQWVVSEDALRSRGFELALVLNDCAVLPSAIACLEGHDLAAIGGVQPGLPGESIGVVVAGTGLGASVLVRDGASASVMVGEAGHTAFAPSTIRQMKILCVLRERFSRVSAERVLSGSGLANIYWALGRLAGCAAEELAPAQITERACMNSDALCVEALSIYCECLGSFVGDMALAFGARGGMYIGGGLAPRLLDFLDKGAFRRAFDDKARLADYVCVIPVKVILHPYAALLGAAEIAVKAQVPKS